MELGMDIILKYFGDFTDKQLQQFQLLGTLYKDWNEKINVISRKDMDGLYEKHILHSLSIAATFDFAAGLEIIDLGTGGGFPGIPLAIFFPEIKFHLVDSIAKKLKVVKAVADAIELKNVTVQHTRIEDIRNRKFHYVVSRAVAPLNELWQWSKPVLHKELSHHVENEANRPGLICLKGGDLNKEIQDSGTRPRMIEIKEIFNEPYFEEKYLLYISK
jgi:16S rRNA (guanine527-N7)-methyltransferase